MHEVDEVCSIYSERQNPPKLAKFDIAVNYFILFFVPVESFQDFFFSEGQSSWT